MKIDGVPFKKTGYFSKLIGDYLDEVNTLDPFYNRFPKIENFKSQIEEKQQNFPKEHRAILSEALQNQYKNFEASDATLENIKALKSENTFTIVTGHQLNLFTGPLYFLYKIISTINLTEELKEKHPESNFVPVYWMATEDHDFDEINYFTLNGKKIQWNVEASGGVGRLSTEGLEVIASTLASELGASKNAVFLTELFKKAYVSHDNLTDATRYLANELFKSYGLVIVDGDDKVLKQLLIPYVKSDLLQNTSFKKVSESIDNLNALNGNYPIQVNPREINYFYLTDGVRERIIEKDGVFYVNDTELRFTEKEILEELNEYPERFSPNVVCRPLYQEIILPNLCYIGGGGELAYWFELKSYFSEVKVTFPMLLLRNSVLLITEKQSEKMEKLELNISHLFLKQNSLINKKIRDISNIDIDFSPQKEHLKAQFESMYELAKQTDESFVGAVKAQEIKQLKGLENLEKRLLKAQKRKLKDHVIRLTSLQNELFPNFSLQERQTNFSEFYLAYGDQLIPALVKHLDPLTTEFEVLVL
ncbi:bacillithiol biosynthesis cysteine-adding enzyme BshC [Cellulophaga baltica]|uniref:bacillithiol biosynthesis cysteine-adding enzyme BshC n=1 Tax=Cellulophaga TaxID=104264 RepID=UPI001C06DAA7|nr:MULTISPECIES: bacillithiol biosynthesis cysteine-adding enzyme BshC [Cellulophaga]MBU2996591.1 bacillithiol biosynthesis cysteine-adding enzyme BshC [Cellulophaga baltica]MDO6767985.1 bacillithiol biosynthesis cysteine-adding enzyme BshC [Cellulophaga sp. 1_MG-2023]